MATAATATHYTLADYAKNVNPNGSIAPVAELLSQMNEILKYMPWIEGNLPTGHRGTVRTSLPTPTWRRLNQGVDPSKSTESQVTDTCGMQEALAVIDKDLAILNGNSAAWRLSRNKSYLEGMAQDMVAQIFYGNTAVNPEKMQGLAVRYGALSTATSQTANNVITGGGSGSANTSIWLLGLGDDKICGITPKGSTAGLQDNDLGEDWAFDANNKRYRAYITQYQWKAGLHVMDWRYGVRIPNIDVTTASGGLKATNPVDLVDLIDQAISRIPNLDACKPVLCMNRTTYRFLNKQRNVGVQASASVNITTIQRTDQGDDRGVIKRIPNYDGIPIAINDQILNTEATVA